MIQENSDQLKKLFPEIVSEGKIDFKTLQQVLGEEIEEGEEFYRFTWSGKYKKGATLMRTGEEGFREKGP